MPTNLDAATLRAIIGRAADTAATILNMSQGFHASDGMREYARVRAEALVEFSQGLAKLLKETEAAAPRPVAEYCLRDDNGYCRVEACRTR